MSIQLDDLEALAFGDRAAALAALLPGTREHDYWRGVHLQHAGKLDEVDALLGGWTEKHGDDESYQRLRRRQLLLRAGGADLGAHADELRLAAGLRLDAQAEVEAAAERRPTRLDPALIDGERLVKEALARRSDLALLQPVALPALVGLPLDAARRRNLLARLERANLPGLVELVAADLDEKSSGGLGSLRVHALLTLAQLEELARLRPALRAHRAWVDAVLARLTPPPHVDWLHDLDARAAQLDRLWAFAGRLSPAWNALKSQILYHRLEVDRARGVHDRARLLAYLDLPRHAPYVSPEWLRAIPQAMIIQPGASAGEAAGLAPVGDDEPLVRDLLAHFLLTEDGADFAARLEAGWLERLIAETRLLCGAPDAERWATRLGPAALAELRDRVEITLTPRNPTRHRAGDPVVLEVDVKNVRELEVKVFRINAAAYFQARGGEADGAIDLDGMVASDERRIAIDLPPIRRSRMTIDLGERCRRPGTYVVELIGNGRSSRAVIRKGDLRRVVRVGAAGPSLLVLDEDGRPLPDARLVLGGREHAARGGGWITLPFSTRGGQVAALLCHGDLARVTHFEHPAESYVLAAGLELQRESLVAGQRARLLLRPTLEVAGTRVSLALVEEPRVEITVTDLAGTTTSRLDPVALRDDAETVVDFFVPDGAVRLAARLRGRVRVVSTQQTVELDDGDEAELNLVHQTAFIETVHLATTAAGHALHVLGKTGEPVAGRAVALALAHRAVTQPVQVTLETDGAGVIELGALPGIETISATLPGRPADVFSLAAPTDAPPRVTAVAGAEVAVPAPREAAWPSLVELRGGLPARDLTALATIERGAIVIRGLEAGAYRLACHGLPGEVAITVAPAQQAPAGWALAGQALVELRPPAPLLRGLGAAGGELVVEISGAGPETRVHLIGLRFRADAALPGSLARPPRPPAISPFAPLQTSYQSGRDIGDEMRYVLERRRAPRRAGTMLEKPWLLLNPWPLRTTRTEVQAAKGGGVYGAAAMRGPMAPSPMMQRSATLGAGQDTSAQRSLDFLAAPAAVLANLRPDAEGRVRVPLADLGAAQLVRAVVVDPELTSSGELPLPARAAAPRDLRLRLALDPARHTVEERRVEPAPAGSKLVVDDVRTGKLELVDTVARAHRLLVTLAPAAADGLRELDFVTGWHALDEATKRARYAKHACHELHLFLAEKDRPFFEAVVRPYLAHRRDKTVVDHYLLGDDLAAFLEPWAFGRLNSVEKVLVARRVPEARAAIARLMGDAVDLIPPDPERDGRLIAALLGAAALEEPTLPAAGEPMELAEEADTDEGAVAGRGARPMAKRARMEKAKLAADMPAPAPAAMAGFAAGGAGFGGAPPMNGLAMDMLERERVEPMYRAADKTQEWAEASWHKKRLEEAGAELIPPNRFWRDLAAASAPSGAPFLSPYLGDCTAGFADAMCALAFLELPFVAAVHERVVEDTRLTVTTGSHALAARTRLVTVEPGPPSSILVGQSTFRADDRFEWEGSEERQKRVTGELLTGVVYGTQVVVTNPTSARRKLDVLLQIPRGALPVSSGFLLRTIPLDLGAYGTQSLEYAYYFPRPGVWSHFPAHVSGGGELAWAAAPPEVTVVRELTSVDTGSWSHVSQRGSLDEVAAFLERANLGRVDLGRAAWRMRDRAAFEKITALLAARLAYDDGLWGYALLHHDRRRAAEWLRHQEGLVRPAGPLLEDGLAPLDPVARGWYQHLEYAPLINARAHQLGARRKILNTALEEQVRAFLELVAHRARPTAGDQLAAACYLLCMDRIDDALPRLAAADRDAVATRLQHDYLSAYVACCRGELAAARAHVTPWLDHPVDRWRQRFALVAAMLDEAAGGARPAATLAQDSREERLDQAAARQPALELIVEKGTIVLGHHNLASCRLRLYKMDLELVFSRQPFVQGDVDRFGFIDPNHDLEVALAGDGRTEVPLPPELRGANLVVEAVAGGLRRAAPLYAHDLAVQLSHAFGQVRVLRASTQAAVPAAYVKVYGRRADQQVAFYKDGYTDARGRFDYATLSTDDLDRVERFALLVVSSGADDAGATVLEAAPPPR